MIARVNGIEIRESDVRAADKEMGRNLGPQQEGRRDEVIKYLINTLMVASAADKSALDEAEIRTRLEFVRNRVISEQVIRIAGRDAVADDRAVRKKYDELIAKMSTDRQYHIFVLDFLFQGAGGESAAKAAEEKVRNARQRIANGEAFEAVARELSDDPSTKANGGNRGYVALNGLGKEFAEVIPLLENDKVSEPIKTKVGWHLVKVVDTRAPSIPDFDQISDRLRDQMAQQAQSDLIEKLRAEARIQRFDETASGQAAPTR
ncbi:peptidylprolyl isomerase [Bradyrhizobium sp. INPA01-394B]|uniref:Parvulin-like PPIase n=1 Tax=Bradyrhizobium campsiandrae TaxID=1729892 RepID=A0ABR7U9V5_9BRAD|nr:peptidylprolyl isomerase [Bradyrhizobium campsiandrae]MBC9879333.1 peptidylprolyl isomerase [Bradyrhizobium campsiandrae]MBC9980737.1 peptidylprolyl isomerase [Bradyrhizobium campsiandrae]